MEVEQVGLDREGIRPKGRTITDVGNGIESLTVHARSRHVDAIARDQFTVWPQVDGRDRVLAAVTATSGRWGGDRGNAAKQMAGASYSSSDDQLPDVAARNRAAAHHHDWIRLHGKTELPA